MLLQISNVHMNCKRFKLLRIVWPILLVMINNCLPTLGKLDSKKDELLLNLLNCKECSATNPSVASPVFSPAAGSYNTNQSLTLTTTTVGATICYTDDLSLPTCNLSSCSNGSQYLIPISITATTTIKAIGCATDLMNSPVVSAVFKIDTTPTAAVASFSSSAGASQVNLSWTNPADPDFASVRILQKLGGPSIDENDGLIIYTGTGTAFIDTGLTNGTTYYYTAFAFDLSGNVSNRSDTSAMPIAGAADSPTFTPPTGTYNSTQTVSLTTTTPSATICYTINGTNPTCSGSCILGTPYTVPVSISTTTIIKGIVCATGYTPSPVSQATITIDTIPPSPVTNLTLIPNDDTLNLTWTNPGDSDFDSVTIVRKTSSAPANKTDGTVVYHGNLQLAFDAGPLTPSTEYFYAAFAEDTVGNVSAATTDSATLMKPWMVNGLITASYPTQFLGVAKDSSSILVVGTQNSTNTYNYGNSIAYTGTHTTNNAILIRYDNSGPVNIVGESGDSSNWARFNSVAVDSVGNIYVAGYIQGATTNDDFTFGSYTIKSLCPYGQTPFVAKLNAAFTYQWVKTVSACGGYADFVSIAVSSSGNDIYVVGSQGGNLNYNYGSGVINGASNSINSVIVKYNNSGVTQWTRTVTSALGNPDTGFKSVTVDTSGNVYIAGYQNTTAAIKYQGDSGTISGASPFSNPVIVKYDSSGVFQWARTITGGSSNAVFQAITAASTTLYVVGYQEGSSNYEYKAAAPGVSATGQSSGSNAVIVAYNNSGVAQWARTTVAPSSLTSKSEFKSVTTDGSGNIYAVGAQYSTDAFSYGASALATATAAGNNSLIVKYNSLGVAKWAKTIASGSTDALFYGVVVDNSNKLCAVGVQSDPMAYKYGNLTLTGIVTGPNSVLVRYE